MLKRNINRISDKESIAFLYFNTILSFNPFLYNFITYPINSIHYIQMNRTIKTFESPKFSKLFLKTDLNTSNFKNNQDSFELPFPSHSFLL